MHGNEAEAEFWGRSDPRGSLGAPRSDPYPWRELAERTSGTWEGYDLALFHYRKANEDGSRDVSSQLVIDFKNGVPEAETRIAEVAAMALAIHADYLQQGGTPVYLVGLPSSSAERSQGPVCRLVTRLGQNLDWTAPLPSLRRTRSVPKSATAAPSERPSVEAHRRSMAWEGPELEPPFAILMVDDVITRGATSSAARQVIMAATGAVRVHGMFVARTERYGVWMSPPHPAEGPI